jgi:hypothetical protein
MQQVPALEIKRLREEEKIEDANECFYKAQY